MHVGSPGPVVVGVLALTGSALFGVLLLLWWFLPNPRLAFTPPPDSPGHRFQCRCYEEPVTVIVLASAEEEQRLADRARRHRRHAKGPKSSWLLRRWRRIRPAPPGHEGAGGTGKGRPPAPVPTL